MLIPLAISSVAAALVAVTSYIPYQSHLKLHGAHLNPGTLATQDQYLNLQHCEPVSPRLPNQSAGPAEPSFCEDVVLDSRTGMAYLSCDPTRLTWDARAGIFEDSGATLHDEIGAPAIWAWDTTQNRLPRRLFISSPPPWAKVQAPADLQSTFHPLGIAVTASNPYYLDEVEPDQDSRPAPPANLVLVANHPYANQTGVVDVFVHDLDKVGGKDNAVLRWIKRIEGEALQARLIDPDEAYTVNPFRIAVYAEQYSESIPRDYTKGSHISTATPQDLVSIEQDPAKLAASWVRVPSLFVTSLPDPALRDYAAKNDARRSALYDAFWKPFAAVLFPSHAKEAPDRLRKIFVYHASVGKTLMSRFDGGEPAQWDTFPPLFQTWDGNGKKGGSNSSVATIFVPSLSSDTAKVQEWEQHWVRGVAGGIREHVIAAPDINNSGNDLKHLIKTYTPSFVNFFSSEREYPIRALAVDNMGRFWTAGNPQTTAVENWISHQRTKRLEKLGLVVSVTPTDAPVRPAANIEQTTFVYRHFGSVIAHPWDFEKLATMKKRGIWLKKEYHTFTVFKSPDEALTQVQARTKDQLIEKGFLPTVPTGLAIDTASGHLYVTGAYEERGIARCKLPHDWVEA